MTLQEEQAPIDRGIADELISCTPEWWTSAKLTIFWRICSDKVDEFDLKISSPEGHSEVINPSDEMAILVNKLGQIFKRRGHPWKSVSYTVQQTDDEQWRFTAEFHYP